jgi:hypothetical protein
LRWTSGSSSFAIRDPSCLIYGFMIVLGKI